MRVLAGEIGPRGTGTAGEAAAADYVVGWLAKLGLPVEQHEFRAVASQNAFPLAADLATLLSVVLYPLAGTPTRCLGAALALAAPLLLWRAITRSDSPLRPLLPHVTSRNVLARLKPTDTLCRRVVLLAHLNTNRCCLAWQSGAERLLEPLTWLTLMVLTSPGMLYLLGAALNGPWWVWWASLLPAGYVLGTALTLWQNERTSFSPGAHDNASNIAVAPEVAARLSDRPLCHTEVWLAFTGAEETDHRGAKTFLSRHASLLRDAAFINLEGVGSGDLVYLTRQGLCWPYRPDPDWAALAGRVAARRPDLGVSPAQMTVEDEVRTLRNRGYVAICVAGRDPITGILPHWHRPADTVSTVSAETMGRTADFITEMVHELDKQGGRP